MAKGLRKIRSVAQQATAGGEFAIMVDRWHCMANRQCGELFDSSVEESTDAEHKPACPQLGQGHESGIELAFAAGLQDPELQSEGARRRLDVFCRGLGKGKGRIDEQRNARKALYLGLTHFLRFLEYRLDRMAMGVGL